MKKITFILFFLGINALVFSQNNTKSIVLEIHNVTISGGTLHISVCTSENSYKSRRSVLTFEFSPINTTIRQEINVPIGECAILVYQDTNNNGQSDTGIFGIPKEPVGISNWDGGSPPGNFRKHKLNINAETITVAINLYKM
ncbi:hypothetical protein Holit_00837 [Hollandina sp. SP2]